MFDFDELDDLPTVHAISDTHCETEANMAWLRRLPICPSHTIVVAGDLAVDIAQIEQALRLFISKYKHVFYCFGNHECWVSKNGPYADSLAKIVAIRELCKSLGVRTETALVDGVWIVPVFGWYHNSWDTEPDLSPPPGMQLRRKPAEAADMSSDYIMCRWGAVANGSEDLAELLDKQNEAWGAWPLPPELLADAEVAPGKRERPILSFSHFLPRLELHPEKRFSMNPNLAKLIGSRWIRSRVEQLRPDVHVFGHTHLCWDMRIDGTRYRSWPLGMPSERLWRAAMFPCPGSEEMLPLQVLSAANEQSPEHEHCFSSRMYNLVDRDPSSCVMWQWVANKYCPGAPVLFDDVVMPGRRHFWEVPEDRAELERMTKAVTVLNQAPMRKHTRMTEWEVIGGNSTGGVQVSELEGLWSPVLGRLSVGAVVEEMKLRGCRLFYNKISGAGPKTGWVSVLSFDGEQLRKVQAPPRSSDLKAHQVVDMLGLLESRMQRPQFRASFEELHRRHTGKDRTLAQFARERRDLLQKEFDAVLPAYGFPKGNMMQLDIAIKPFLNTVTGDEDAKGYRQRLQELMMLY